MVVSPIRSLLTENIKWERPCGKAYHCTPHS
jgi:hypothetical protein